MALTVAIVGSGPAGFYTADALLSAGVDVEVDIIERLPTPFGLIRAGVAPDHQTTKNVTRKYEESALHDVTRYYGNVTLGKDVHLHELREMYDAVVLAVGAASDVRLSIPGADLDGVYGSSEFVGWYNAHPDYRWLDPDLETEQAVVIGNGNVALDIARILVRTRTGMASSDLADHAGEAIWASPLKTVHMIGRRGPLEAKFTNVELRELADLTNCLPVVDPAQLPDEVPANGAAGRELRLKQRNLETLRSFLDISPEGKEKRLNISFYAQPVEIIGDTHVEAIRFERTRVEDGRTKGTGEFFDIPTKLVVAAIGYRAIPLDGAPFDEAAGVIPNDDGKVEDGLYVVGWIKRGPTGVISSSRPDAKSATAHILADCGEGGKPGRRTLAGLLKERGTRVVTYADWKRIEAAEKEAAGSDAPRRKYATIEEMLDVLEG
jgi:ferredoxin--NADP+ reductase